MPIRFSSCCCLFALLVIGNAALCQQGTVVQPGAPGAPSKTLPVTTTAAAPRAPQPADVAFMQGMIMHHSQAVEMTAMLKSRSHDPEVQALGERINISQGDEIKFMKRWLLARGIAPEEPMSDMPDMPGMTMPSMPGMLTHAQMVTLRAAAGPAFDHLFLTGMVQHHTGALTMVRQLTDTPGANQDADLFDFVSDVVNTQQAEIDIMRGLLAKEKH